jgi:hypothetical protein
LWIFTNKEQESMDINELSAGTEASSGWRPHPFGSFAATVTEVRKETITGKGQQVGKPVWKIVCQTARGTAEYTVWDFTQQDIQMASQSADHKDRMIKAIGRTKRMLGDLGVATDETLKLAGWNNGVGSVTGYLGQAIMGAKCTLVVEPSRPDPANPSAPPRQVVYINKFVDAPDKETMPAGAMPPAQAAPGMPQQPMMPGMPAQGAAQAGPPTGQFAPPQGTMPGY